MYNEEETLRICKKYNIDVVKKEGLPLYNGENMDENFSFEKIFFSAFPTNSSSTGVIVAVSFSTTFSKE